MYLLKTKILSSFILIASLLLIPTASNSGGKTVTKHLERAQFTTTIKNRNPVNNLKSVDTAYKNVYFFVTVRNCNDCEIEHEWWYRGKKVSAVDGDIKSDKYRWWSKKNISGRLGDWTVKVFLNGNLEYTKTVTYQTASLQQKQARPIEKRVQIREASECEVQLRYFSDKIKEEPQDPYYNFMLKKWGKRCIPK